MRAGGRGGRGELGRWAAAVGGPPLLLLLRRQHRACPRSQWAGCALHWCAQRARLRGAGTRVEVVRRGCGGFSYAGSHWGWWVASGEEKQGRGRAVSPLPLRAAWAGGTHERAQSGGSPPRAPSHPQLAHKTHTTARGQRLPAHPSKNSPPSAWAHPLVATRRSAPPPPFLPPLEVSRVAWGQPLGLSGGRTGAGAAGAPKDAAPRGRSQRGAAAAGA